MAIINDRISSRKEFLEVISVTKLRGLRELSASRILCKKFKQLFNRVFNKRSETPIAKQLKIKQKH